MNRGLKWNLRTLWAFVLAIVIGGCLHAQDITGTWQGTITPPQGTPHRIVLRVIHDNSGAFKAKIYSIDQDFTGDWADSITVHDSTVQFAEFTRQTCRVYSSDGTGTLGAHLSTGRR
jgi:hypothetical protein